MPLPQSPFHFPIRSRVLILTVVMRWPDQFLPCLLTVNDNGLWTLDNLSITWWLNLVYLYFLTDYSPMASYPGLHGGLISSGQLIRPSSMHFQTMEWIVIAATTRAMIYWWILDERRKRMMIKTGNVLCIIYVCW